MERDVQHNRGKKAPMVIETQGVEAIEETRVELQRHSYLLATIPDLRIVVSSDMVKYGHYLAAHRSYFEQKLQ